MVSFGVSKLPVSFWNILQFEERKFFKKKKKKNCWKHWKRACCKRRWSSSRPKQIDIYICEEARNTLKKLKTSHSKKCPKKGAGAFLVKFTKWSRNRKSGHYLVSHRCLRDRGGLEEVKLGSLRFSMLYLNTVSSKISCRVCIIKWFLVGIPILIISVANFWPLLFEIS